MIVVFGGKGGSGKSTVLRAIAVEWMRRGYRVAIIDADYQGTVLAWFNVAQHRSIIVPHVRGASDGTLIELVRRVEQNVDLVLIDTPGRLDQLHIKAMLAAHVVILPCLAAPDDVRALYVSTDAYTKIRDSRRPDLRSLIVVNRKERTNISRDSIAAIKKNQAGLPVAKIELRPYDDYKKAAAIGMGVTVFAPSSEASRQMRELADEIEETFSDIFPPRPAADLPEEEPEASIDDMIAQAAAEEGEGENRAIQ